MCLQHKSKSGTGTCCLWHRGPAWEVCSMQCPTGPALPTDFSMARSGPEILIQLTGLDESDTPELHIPEEGEFVPKSLYIVCLNYIIQKKYITKSISGVLKDVP